MVKKTALFVVHSLFFFLFFGVFFTGIFAFYIRNQDKQLQDKIYPNVYIDGRSFGRKTAVDIANYAAKKDSELQKITVGINYRGVDIATFSGTMLNIHHDSNAIMNKAWSVGRNPQLLKRSQEKIVTLFGLARYDYNTTVSYDVKPVVEYLDSLALANDVIPENALFRYENGRVTAFKVEKKGIRVNKNKAIANLNNFLRHNLDRTNSVIQVTVEDEVVMPEVTLATINEFGIAEKIGEGQSDYTGSIASRIHNVLLASSKFDGALIPKGETFSFNRILGEITAKTGYQPAYIIQGGRTVLGDGGGVCQVSTTMFRTALNTGLPIIKRTAHAYRVRYYENDQKPGLDATVFSPSVDLQFTNDTSAHILIQREVDTVNHILKFVFYGKKDDRIVEISPVEVYGIRPAPPPLYQDDPSLKKGVVKQVDWAAVGTKTRFHYRVARQDQVLVDQDFFSNFRPWQAVYLVGTAD